MIPLPPDAPAWFQALHAECSRTSQAACARLLEVSPATVNLVLKGTYNASTKNFEERVKKTLLSDVRSCPVLGDLDAARCLEEQARPYYPDPIRSALSRACRTCAYAQARKDAK